MKIALFDNGAIVERNGQYYSVDGTGKFAHELKDLGNDVTMIGQIAHGRQGISNYNLTESGVDVVGVSLRHNKIVRHLMLHFRAVRHILKSDFCYFFYPTANRYIALFCAIIGKKYGLYIRGDEGIKSKLSFYLYRRATTVFTVSDGFTAMVNEVNPKQIAHTIRPMIAYDERDVVMDRNYRQHSPFKILFLCRVDRTKGVDELLNAVGIINKEKPDSLAVSIVGDGSYLEAAKKLAQNLSISHLFTFYGAVTDNELKKTLYLDSDLYVLPTFYREGFPRTLYEAMIFGTPIITTFVAGIPGLMVDGQNCKRVIEKSVSDLVSCLSYAMENYGEMAKLAHNATQTVLPIIDSRRLTHAEDLNKIIKDNNR